jgi:triosephosphate isomerase (TIM)
MSRRQLIAGNWKMNTTRSEARALTGAIASGFSRTDLDVALFPPFLWLSDVTALADGTQVAVGAQNCWSAPKGAFTGEISPVMIAELGSLVLIGHSERRQLLGETDAIVRAKIDAALATPLTPVVCVGESLDTRQQGNAVAYVSTQISAALADRPGADLNRLVVAYEPIWAIGTGVAATASDAQEMCAAIRLAIAAFSPAVASGIRILYGGSMTPANARELLTQPDVDGGLVGGASLKAADFLEIIAAAPQRD